MEHTYFCGTYIYLCNILMRTEGARELAESLRYNTSLQYLGLAFNGFGDVGARVCCSLHCCSVLQCPLLQCVAVTHCCSVLQCVAVWCSGYSTALMTLALGCGAVCCGVVRCGAVWCSMVRCVAVWCGVLRCVAVWCSVVQCVAR